MKHGGIISAAIEVIADIETRRRPATDALRDWGLAHRFAGSGDRAAVGNLVFDALRCRASIAWRMASDTPRALAIGAYGFLWARNLEQVEITFAADRHAPEPLTDAEKIALRTATLEGAPSHVAGDYPEWLHGALERVFGETAEDEGRALACRAPVDLRVNTLKGSRDRVLRALSRFGPEPAPFAPFGVRVAVGTGPARAPNLTSEPGYRKGQFEIQDAGSQLAALLAGARPGLQLADVCAGAGGKTLALAAMMENTGQIHAWDADRHRLADIHERLQRAGVRNTQVLRAGDAEALAALENRMDLVLVDAPCTGAGTWRRRPDAKWRVTEKALMERSAEQKAALETAAPLVRPGGRLVYVTCSLLAEENEDQVSAFVTDHPDFVPVPPAAMIAAAFDPETAAGFEASILIRPTGLLMTPRMTGTDGFFVAMLERVGQTG